MRSVKNRFNPFNSSAKFAKLFLTFAYLLIVPIYIIVGLQPAIAADPASDQALIIPSLNLRSPVQKLTRVGNTLPTPNYLPGSYREQPNKTLLIGHSTTIFQNLHQLQTGAQITFADQTYRVTRIVTTPKQLISMLSILAAAKRPTLILMTCAGDPLGHQDYTHRLIITAVVE